MNESCISNPKSQVGLPLFEEGIKPVAKAAQAVQPEISDFGFEMQDWSNFKMFPLRSLGVNLYSLAVFPPALQPTFC